MSRSLQERDGSHRGSFRRLRRRRGFVLVTALAGLIATGLVPGASQAHHLNSVEEHFEEDFVIHSPAKERRLERHTARVTAKDVKAAKLANPDPAQVGDWGPVVDWPVVGVHVALLTNGKVLAYDSVGDNAAETYPVHNFSRATVWDPQTGVQTPATVTTGFNIFCSGLAHLMDGTLFVAGGNKNSSLQGIAQTHLFNQTTNTWSRGADMTEERWYPTVTPLNDGEMLITEGGPDVPEVRQTNGTIRRLSTASLNQPLYPWMDVAPDGRAFYSGPDNRMGSLNPSGTGAWQLHGARDGFNRDYGSHAMYDIGKILVSGGGNSLSSARTINLNGASPVVSNTGSMATGRRQHNLTVLADGTVLATGGNSSGAALVDLNNGVYTAELWNPATGTWRTLDSMQVTRQYHSTALLLPDGRVLSAGGGICGECDAQGYLAKNAEIFSPPYLFKNDGSGQLAARPTITSAPGTVSYNAPFSIDTPNPGAIGKVAMVRLGAVTHSVNMEQRYVPLSFTAGGGSITATAPLNANVAPPGFYMLFVIGSNGVPSVAEMVRIDSDSTAPGTPSITDTDPDSPANDNNPEVKGSADAGSTVKIYSTAGCSGSPLATGSAAGFGGAGITTPVPGDQTTNLKATATDAAGNASPCSSALAYTEDSTAPQTQIDSGPTDPTNDATPTFGFSASGNPASFECRFDSASFTSCSTPHTASPALADGAHTFEVRAIDQAQNTDQSPASRSFTLDTVAPPSPNLNATDPPSPANDNNPEVKGSADAGSTVKIYSTAGCSGSPLATGSAAGFGGAGITTPVPGDQTTNLKATATDAAGNASPCSSALAYTEDSTAPQTQIDSGPTDPTNDATPTFGFSASGNPASFECRFDSASFTSCSTPHTASPALADGAHTFEVRAIDQAQNTDQSPASRSFTVDTLAPQTQIDSGPTDPTNDATPTFGFSASGNPASFECRFDSASFTSCSTPHTASPALADGAHTFEVRAIDQAQNTDQSPASRSFTLDTVAPQTQIDSGPTDPTNDATPTFGFSASGNPASFECRFDSASFTSCSTPHTASPALADGAHTFEVRAIDQAQNTDQSPASRSFTLDTLAPPSPNLNATDPPSPANENNPKVKGSAEAGSTVEIYSTSDCSGTALAGGTAAGLSGAGITVTVPSNETSNLRAAATDSAGNTSGCSPALLYTEDSSPPSVPAVDDTDPDSPANDNSPEVRGSGAEAGSTVRIYGDSNCTGPVLGQGSAAAFNGATGITITVGGDQTTNLRATATDATGNTSPCSSPLSYTEDSTAPGTPRLTDTDPESPANDTSPEVKGIADPDSTVRIYSTTDCSGEPLGPGTTAEFSSPGITVHVPADQATDLRASAIDAAGNDSGCSSPISYVDDSTPPDSLLTEQPPEKTTKRRVKLAFSSSEPGSTFRCSLDRKAAEPCDSPWQKRVELGRHVFHVYALDPSGNADPTPAKAKFKVIE